jgi:hypothetical protein
MTEYKRQLNRLMPDALLAEDGMTVALDREGEIVAVTYEKRHRPMKFANDRCANGESLLSRSEKDATSANDAKPNPAG